jgi:hypothetical protein
MEDEDIRAPDEVIKERLIDIVDRDFTNNYSDEINETEEDRELKLALNISKEELYKNEDDDELMRIIELSEKEHELYVETIKNESILIEKEKRMNSIKLFCNKIKTLNYTKEDIIIKKYLETVLDDYFNLNIDYIIVEDENMYNNLFNIIDSYYLIPFNKNLKKTAITKEEDMILRSILLK